MFFEDIAIPSKCEIKGCQVCIEDILYNSYDDYINEQKKRFFNKNELMHNRMMKNQLKIRYC